jgi:hypothetical protein
VSRDIDEKQRKENLKRKRVPGVEQKKASWHSPYLLVLL